MHIDIALHFIGREMGSYHQDVKALKRMQVQPDGA
jgi:hypothetical protein